MPVTTGKNIDGDKLFAVLQLARRRQTEAADIANALGARGLLTPREVGVALEGAGGEFEHLIQPFMPNLRLMSSPFAVSRRAVSELLEMPDLDGTGADTIDARPPVETVKRQLAGDAERTYREMMDVFRQASTTGGFEGTEEAFLTAVVQAVRRADDRPHANAAVERARAEFEGLLKRLARTLTQVDPSLAPVDELVRRLTRLPVGEMLLGRQEDVAKAVTESLRPASPATAVSAPEGVLEAMGRRAVREWLYLPEGRVAYDTIVHSGDEDATPPVAVSDAVLQERGVLVQDAYTLLHAVAQTVGVDAELATRYGDTQGGALFAALDREVDAAAAASPEAEGRLRARAAADRRDLAHVIAELRGLHAAPITSVARLSHTVRQTAGLSPLGMSTFSALPSVAYSVIAYGMLPTVRTTWLPWWDAASEELYSPQSAEVEQLQSVARMLNIRSAMAARGEVRTTGFSSVVNSEVLPFEHARLYHAAGFWHELETDILTAVVHDGLLRIARDFDRHGRPPVRGATVLDAVDLSAGELQRIARQVEVHGQRVADWEDGDLGAAFLGILSEHVERTQSTLDAGDPPQTLVSDTIATHLLRLRAAGVGSFARSLVPVAHELMLSDALATWHAVQYIFFAAWIGFLSDATQRWLAKDGRELSPRELLDRALRRSGVWGLLPDVLSGANGRDRTWLSQTFRLEEQFGPVVSDSGAVVGGAAFSLAADLFRSRDRAGGDSESPAVGPTAVAAALPYHNLQQIQAAFEANPYLTLNQVGEQGV